MKTNGETLKWYNENIKYSKMSQDDIKVAAVKFFGGQFELLNKNTIQIHLLLFKNEQKSLINKLKVQILRNKNGKGKHYDDPPEDFIPTSKNVQTNFKFQNGQYYCEQCGEYVTDIVVHIKEEKHYNDLKQAFQSYCKSEVKYNIQYINWLNKTTEVEKIIETKGSDKKVDLDKTLEKMFKDQTNHDDGSFKITKERSSGKNIVDTERVVLSRNEDGTLKKIL